MNRRADRTGPEEDPSDRTLLKISQLVCDQLRLLKKHRHLEVLRHLETLADSMEQLQHARRRLLISTERNWEVAASSVTGSVRRILDDVSVVADALQRALELSEVSLPSSRDVLAEIQQAQEEFPALRWYPEETTLAVVTEPVELQERYLGDFEIQACLARCSSLPLAGACRVVALDPHPASGDERVTHPHVRDEVLCAGDGATAMHTALASGRLCDFFILAWSVLRNYNPDSAYVSLANWNGRACHECGSTADGDDLSWCSSCENDFCGECSSYCARCAEPTCLNCLERCPVCDESVCSGCITKCPECEARLCSKCREEGKCPCHDEKEETEDEPNDNQGLPAAGEGAASDQSAGEGEEFYIINVNDLARPAAQGAPVDPA